jgi:enoyl-CoA hydratase/carnithine racemase
MDDLAPDLVVTAEGPIRLIELNRPEQLNAASEALHSALAGVWDRLAADDQVQAVVLTGRGRAEGAYLADPHVQVGLVAGDGGAMVLPLIVGLARAKQLLFLGERVSGEEAVRLGLANRVVPGDKLLDEAMDLARRLAALPAGALRDTKRAVNLHLEQAMGTVMEIALAAERDSMHSPEHVAIVAKLIAKSS